MQITEAKYNSFAFITGVENVSITAVIDGEEKIVPLDPDNRHYAEILKQVDAGTLVIQEATNV